MYVLAWRCNFLGGLQPHNSLRPHFVGQFLFLLPLHDEYSPSAGGPKGGKDAPNIGMAMYSGRLASTRWADRRPPCFRIGYQANRLFKSRSCGLLVSLWPSVLHLAGKGGMQSGCPDLLRSAIGGAGWWKGGGVICLHPCPARIFPAGNAQGSNYLCQGASA